MGIRIEAAQRLIARSGEVEIYVYNSMGRLISSDSYNPATLQSIFGDDLDALQRGNIVRYQQKGNTYYRCMQDTADKATHRLNLRDPKIIDSAE